jgi:hypothetical protein
MKFFPVFEPHPDGNALSSGRSHFQCMQFPYKGFVRPDRGNGHPDRGNGRPDGWFDVRNFHIWCNRVETMLTGVRTSRFWIRYLPYGWVCPNRNPLRPDGCSNLPIIVFWKEILKLVEHWVSSRHAAEMSGRVQAGEVRNFSTQGKVGRKVLVVQMEDALDRWGSEWYDMLSGRLARNQIFCLANYVKSSGSTSE